MKFHKSMRTLKAKKMIKAVISHNYVEYSTTPFTDATEAVLKPRGTKMIMTCYNLLEAKGGLFVQT